MIGGPPSPFATSRSGGRARGIEPFLDRHADEYRRYGTGKVALRDGLAGLTSPGETVLVPAYLPDAVVEPISDLGLDAEYYAVEPTLAPDFADLERRLDDGTAAVLSVNYFGFPTPGFDELRSIVADADCYHVDDNAHAPLSLADGTLLGTRGHVGITSLWKAFPIPDGAVLYLNDGRAIDAYQPSPAAGVRNGIDAADCLFVLKSMLRSVLDERGAVRRSIDVLVAGSDHTPSVAPPRERYESGKHRMSKLSAAILDSVDPESVRCTRRENYRRWRRALAHREDLEILFETLPEGISPQVFPVRADRPGALRSELEHCGVAGVKTWPRLANAVREDPTYETATRLAREVVTLPVHQQVDPAAIDAVGERLER